MGATLDDLLYRLVRPLTATPDRVRIVHVEHPAGDRYDVHVAPADFARVVGRGGRTARALRTVLSAAASDGEPPFLNLVDPEEEADGEGAPANG